MIKEGKAPPSVECCTAVLARLPTGRTMARDSKSPSPASVLHGHNSVLGRSSGDELRNGRRALGPPGARGDRQRRVGAVRVRRAGGDGALEGSTGTRCRECRHTVRPLDWTELDGVRKLRGFLAVVDGWINGVKRTSCRC